MLVIPETAVENTDTAKKKFIDALNEQKTAFLLFRSNPRNEDEIQAKADMADNYAKNWNAAEYRVIWIKNQDILKDIVVEYFGFDGNIIAVSLHYGSGEHRNVVKKYKLPDLMDNFDMGEAFSGAY